MVRQPSLLTGHFNSIEKGTKTRYSLLIYGIIGSRHECFNFTLSNVGKHL